MANELVDLWRERIERAKKIRDEWESEFSIEKGRQYFAGKQNPGNVPAAEWITINKVYSHMMAQLPMLYSVDPYFYVRLKKSYSVSPEDIARFEAMGKTRQGMLNYLKGELNLKTKARMGIQDAHFEFGVLKVRRASDSKEHPHAGEPILDDDGKELKDEDGKTLTYPDELPINERYELCRIHPRDILFDEDAGPLEDSWSWIAQHISMKKSDALKDPRYKRSAVKSIKPKRREERMQKRHSIVSTVINAFKRPDDNEFIDLYEIYDLKEREFLVYADDADELLIKPRTLPPGVEKHPFSFLRFTLQDDSPYPIPPVYPALDPQREYSLSRSRLLTHRKRFNRKYEVDVNKLADPDVELSKLESGEDGTMIRVQALGAVNAIEDAPLDQAGLVELNLLNMDLVEIFGTPASARGIADADSATEASLLDRRLEVREGDRLSMVVDWIIDIARKLDQLVQTHIDKDEAVKITGVQGDFWQVIRESDYRQIEGEYEYAVNLGSTQPRLPDIERSQWIAFLSQVIVPFPHLLTAPAIMKRIAAMFHIEDDAALEEFRQLGVKMMSGQMPMPGQTGGGPSNNPVAAILGAAAGPSGGNANGGGAPQTMQ